MNRRVVFKKIYDLKRLQDLVVGGSSYDLRFKNIIGVSRWQFFGLD